MRIQPVFGRGGLLAFTLTALLAAPASAQVDTGTISGTVKDETGGVLPGATVTITHEGQGFTLSTVTREDGTYVFTPIRTGAYVIESELAGFRKGRAARDHRRHPGTGARRLLAPDRRRWLKK